MTATVKKVLAAALLAAGGALIVWNARAGSGIERGLPNTTRRDIASRVAELPPAVQATIQRESQGGTLQDLDVDGESTNRKYEVDIIKGQTKITLQIAADGTVGKRKSKPTKP